MTQVETRKYSLAILIILVLFCWPAAILYYFTRPKIIRQEGYAPPPTSRACLQCGRVVPDNVRFCPNCGKQLN